MRKAKIGERLIDLNRYSEQECNELKKQKDFYCPLCLMPVLLKSGPRRRHHFSHLKPCKYEYIENESQEHLEAKKILSSWLESQKIPSKLEYPIKEIRRIPDVYFEWKGAKYVFEIQKSYISESVFRERTEAYERFKITVFWIFIGKVLRKKNTFLLNSVMSFSQGMQIIHLYLPTRRITIFHQISWITRKEIEAQSQRYLLEGMSIDDLIKQKNVEIKHRRERWLDIKSEFRTLKWQRYMRNESVLVRFCATQQINLSLLPAEVGWPVSGNGFRKSIFIWQASVLMAIVIKYSIGDYFTLSELIKKIKRFNNLTWEKESLDQLKEYIRMLIDFEILSYENSYFEYRKEPIFYTRLEDVLTEDQNLSLKVFK